MKDTKLTASKLSEANRRKQSAILGLCALVDAHPYTIPEFLPEVLMVLSDCLHDGPIMAVGTFFEAFVKSKLPLPFIKITYLQKPIKKSLQEFKRTHQVHSF